MIREGDICEKLFPDFPDMKVDFSEIGIGKIGKIGLAPPPVYTVNYVYTLKYVVKCLMGGCTVNILYSRNS